VVVPWACQVGGGHAGGHAAGISLVCITTLAPRAGASLPLLFHRLAPDPKALCRPSIITTRHRHAWRGCFHSTCRRLLAAETTWAWTPETVEIRRLLRVASHFFRLGFTHVPGFSLWLVALSLDRPSKSKAFSRSEALASENEGWFAPKGKCWTAKPATAAAPCLRGDGDLVALLPAPTSQGCPCSAMSRRFTLGAQVQDPDAGSRKWSRN